MMQEEENQNPTTLKVALQQQLFASSSGSSSPLIGSSIEGTPHHNLRNSIGNRVVVNSFADAELLSTVDGGRVPVISSILATRCPYFATLFFGRFNAPRQQQQQRQQHTKVIQLPYKSIHLRAIVEYCYTDTIILTLLLHQRQEKKKEKKQNLTASTKTDNDGTTMAMRKDEENGKHSPGGNTWDFVLPMMMELIDIADYFGLQHLCIWIMNKYSPTIWVILSKFHDMIFVNNDVDVVDVILEDRVKENVAPNDPNSDDNHPLLWNIAYQILETKFDACILDLEDDEIKRNLVMSFLSQSLLERIVSDKLLNGITELQLFQLIQLWVQYYQETNDCNSHRREEEEGEEEEKEEEEKAVSQDRRNSPRSVAKWLIHDHIRLEYIEPRKFQEIVVPSGLISAKGIDKINHRRNQLLVNSSIDNNSQPNSPPSSVSENNNTHSSLTMVAKSNDRVLEILRGSHWNTTPGFEDMKTNKGMNKNRCLYNGSSTLFTQPLSSQSSKLSQLRPHEDFLEFRPMKSHTIHQWSIKIIKSSHRMSFGVILATPTAARDSSSDGANDARGTLSRRNNGTQLNSTSNKTSGWLMYDVKQNSGKREDAQSRAHEDGADKNSDVDDEKTGSDITRKNNRMETASSPMNVEETSLSKTSSPFLKKYYQGNQFSIVQLQPNSMTKDNVKNNQVNRSKQNVLLDGTIIKFKLDLTNQGRLYANIILKEERQNTRSKNKIEGDKKNSVKKKRKKEKQNDDDGFILLFDNLLVTEEEDDDDEIERTGARRRKRLDTQRSFLPAGAIQGPGKAKFLGIRDRASV